MKSHKIGKATIMDHKNAYLIRQIIFKTPQIFYRIQALKLVVVCIPTVTVIVLPTVFCFK